MAGWDGCLLCAKARTSTLSVEMPKTFDGFDLGAFQVRDTWLNCPLKTLAEKHKSKLQRELHCKTFHLLVSFVQGIYI